MTGCFPRRVPAAAAGPKDRFLETVDEGFDAVQLRGLRHDAVPAYLDHIMSITDWDRFDVVGFTSTFQQNVASFALARRLKAAHPQLCTLFGGANFDQEMGEELVRGIPAIDYAINGEADHAFPEFLEAMAGNRDPAAVPGVMCRRNGVCGCPNRGHRSIGWMNCRCPTTTNISSGSSGWS